MLFVVYVVLGVCFGWFVCLWVLLVVVLLVHLVLSCLDVCVLILLGVACLFWFIRTYLVGLLGLAFVGCDCLLVVLFAFGLVVCYW